MNLIFEDNKTQPVLKNTEQLSFQLKESKTLHPALNRMRDKLNENAKNAGVITDYSRMHHRHSRS